jgi:hypothetical protein
VLLLGASVIMYRQGVRAASIGLADNMSPRLVHVDPKEGTWLKRCSVLGAV